MPIPKSLNQKSISSVSRQVKWNNQLCVENLKSSCLSAFAVLVHVYHGQDDVSVLQIELDKGVDGSMKARILPVSFNPGSTLQEVKSAVSNGDPAQYQKHLENIPQIAICISNQAAPVDDEWIWMVFERLQIETLVLVSSRPHSTNLTAYTKAGKPPSYDPHALLESFENILSLSHQPSTKVRDMDIISSHDTRRINQWNKTIRSHGPFTIHGLINKNYHQRPSSIAICSSAESISYRELGQQSAIISRLLGEHGVKRGQRVGICMKKSPQMIIAIVGILRAGAAYVPIDHSSPPERIALVLKWAGVNVVVTEECLFDRFSATDQDLQLLTPKLSQNNGSVIPWRHETEKDTASPAYIMFTSGSTGTPKGVIQNHDAVSGSLLEMINCLGLNDRTRFLQYASISFDASILGVFAPLIAGGCVCIPSDEERLYDLEATMERLGVTDASLTPVIASQINPENLPTLKSLSIGGDASSREILSKWSQRVRLHNIYGTTETGVWDTVKLDLTPLDSPKNVGRGVGAACWIVDPDNHAVLRPVGTEGEILIQGPYLAAGYLDNGPSRTDSPFIHPPKWIESFPSATRYQMYKTGDLGRYTEDGDIILSGRKSGFVKIHGLRIELGEIEAQLNSIIANGRAAVIVDERQGDPAIVAFVKTGNADVSVDEMRQSLSKVLPAYMIPSLFILLDTMPLTASKKIDRQSLRRRLAQLSSEELMQLRGSSTADLQAIPSHQGLAVEVCDLIVDILESNTSQSMDFLRGKNFQLSTVGLDSIKPAVLASRLRKQYGKNNISIAHLQRPNMTVCDLESLLSTTDINPKTESSEVDLLSKLESLKKDLILPAKMTVFLTSITGYLGSHLLRYLLQHAHIDRVIGLVRAADQQTAFEKVKNQAEMGKWWKDEYQSRIEIWLGDLSKPHLGLSPDHWNTLTGNGHRRVDRIIHNEAKVNWLESYSTLKSTNVLSTIEIMTAMSEMETPRPLMYISGGYLSFTNESQQQIARRLSTASGYDQTKFMSELLLDEYNAHLEARSSRLPRALTIKPGFIVGTAAEGVSHPEDFIWRLAYSILRLGSVSRDLIHLHIPVTGLDQISGLVINHLFTNTQETSLQCLDGIPMSTFCYILTSKTNIAIQPMDHGKWMENLRTDIEQTENEHPFLPLLEEFEKNVFDFLGDGSTLNQYINAKDIIAAVEKSTAYMIGIGFLPCDGFPTEMVDGGVVFHRSK